MTEALLRKVQGGALIPADDESAEALMRVKSGDLVRVKWAQPRNVKFMRKFFAMLNVGFEAWEPPAQEYRGLPVQKNFERFRKDVVIAAGFYDPVANLKGEVRAEAKSISFANMTEDEFEKVYSTVANVLLQKVLRNYTRDDLDRVVEELMRF